jgi:hypothetical protein
MVTLMPRYAALYRRGVGPTDAWWSYKWPTSCPSHLSDWSGQETSVKCLVGWRYGGESVGPGAGARTTDSRKAILSAYRQEVLPRSLSSWRVLP